MKEKEEIKILKKETLIPKKEEKNLQILEKGESFEDSEDFNPESFNLAKEWLTYLKIILKEQDN